MGVYGIFLMSRTSTWFWQTLPLLYRLLFPWRVMTLVSVAIAVTCGCLLSWKDRRAMLALVVWAAANSCIVSILDAKRNARLVPFKEPHMAAEIASQHLAPDVQDERFPRRAKTDRNRLVERHVAMGPGSEVSEYTQQQGLLQCDLRTDRVSYVILPHFYYPVGLRASMANRL